MALARAGPQVEHHAALAAVHVDENPRHAGSGAAET
jgi:hypothetical protein